MSLDARLLGMTAALAVIWIALHVLSDGVFLSARNLYNLAVQTSVVGVMATGMVLVIVARHIDLSVGSVLGVTGMLVAWIQVEVLPGGVVWNPWASVVFGLAIGAVIGAWQGWWVAYRGVPAFVVTLAGLLIFRGAAYLVTDGRTVAPLEPAFQVLGGGLHGSIGSTWSWILGGVAMVVVGGIGWHSRAGRREHGLPMRPIVVDAGVVALWCAFIVAFVGVMNAATRPRTDIPRGVPVPVLILLTVGALMAALARVTRFGRHVFALGGSPEAAALAGIDVRRTTLLVFVTMGLLAGIAGVVTAARLGAGTSSMGTLAELSVIAAAVLGGTSLSGGAGSVGGALLGALLMQSLENGMVLLGASSALRQVSIGLVLIVAVWVDTRHRSRHSR